MHIQCLTLCRVDVMMAQTLRPHENFNIQGDSCNSHAPSNFQIASVKARFEDVNNVKKHNKKSNSDIKYKNINDKKINTI